MPDNQTQPSRRLLDPVERVSEILFGLIMALTFTCSISAGSTEHGEIRTLLFGAIGCNLAWGLVDAAMYLIARLTERRRGLLTFRRVRAARDPDEARQLIADALPPVLAATLSPDELDDMRGKLLAVTEPPEWSPLTAADFRAAFGVLCLVFLSTFPLVIPFLFMHDAHRALRTSNAIALVLLYLCGHALGRHAGHHPWRMGLGMMLIGVALVGLTMALGG